MNVSNNLSSANDCEHNHLVNGAILTSGDCFEQLAQNAPIAIFVKDLDGRYTVANPLACAALGRASAVGLNDHEMLDQASADQIRQHDLQVIETRTSIEIEECVQRGEFIQDYLAVKFPLFDKQGEVQGVCGVAVDVTQRHRAEKALERTRLDSDRQRRLYEAVLDGTPDLAYVFDLAGRFTYANNALLQMWGKTKDEAIGKNCLELGYPEWHAAMHQREIEVVVATKKSIKGEIPFTGTHGTRNYEYIFVPVLDENGEVEAVAGSTRDVTDRKASEENTRKIQERYRQLVEGLPAAVYTCGVDGNLELFNDAAVKLWGRTPEVGTDLWCGSFKMFHPDGTRLTAEECPIAIALKERRAIDGQEIVVERPDGSRVHSMQYPQPIYDDQGHLIGAINMLLDVTEQRRAEGDRALLAAIVSSSDDAIISKTLDGIITSWNTGAERIFGYTAEEVIGQSIMMVIPPDRHAEERGILDRIRRGQRVEHFETVRISKDGKLFDLSLTVSPVRDASGRVIGASKVARNISDRLLAAQALRESEERFRTVANHAPVGIFQTDLDGNTTFVNESWCQLSGLENFEAQGDRWINAVHPMDRERVISDWQFAHSQGLSSQSEFRFRRPDGSVAWLQGNAEPLRDTHGSMVGYIGTVVDITSRKLAEQALSENEQRIAAELASMNSLYELTVRLLGAESLEAALQEVLNSAIAFQRADMGCVHLYDPTAAQYRVAAEFGFDHAMLEELADPEFNPNSACGRALNSGKRVIIEDVTLDRDYRNFLPFAKNTGYRTIQSTPLKSRSGVVLGLLSTHFRAPRKLASRELRMLDLYARQAADFIEQLQLINSMREADHRKDEFLAMLAHELRNPLAPIRSGLDYLAVSDRLCAGDSESNEVLGIMRDQVEHLVRLVDDLLDVSRIARGKVELRKEIVAVAPLVERAVDSILWAFQAKDQVLEVLVSSEPIHIDADSVRLVQVLGNLLNNASKYTPAGGHIQLTVAHVGNDVVFQVKDNGIGIEPELLPNVFDLFTQSSRALDRAQGGMGIGLTLVRSLVELHSGTVSAQSPGIGQGSEFMISLPVSSQSPATEAAHVRAPSHRRRILVVDDNFGAARLVCVLLKKLGDHQVEMAHDGPSALEQIAGFDPEIVLLDIGLPGMNGYEVARRIREEYGHQPLLVALTGYGRPEDVNDSKSAGFDEHLVKPPSLEMLERLLAHRQLPDPLANG